MGKHSKRIFMVEIRIEEGDMWAPSPKRFNDKEKAEEFAKALKHKYSLISDCRVITRRIEQGKEKI